MIKSVTDMINHSISADISVDVFARARIGNRLGLLLTDLGLRLNSP